MRPSRVLWPVTAVVLLLTISVDPATAAPPYTLEERAEAIAKPALVFIEAEARGYIRNKSTGEQMTPDEFVAYNRCSGFVVNSAGYLLTSAQCVEPPASTWRGFAFTAFADREIGAGRLTEEGRAAFIADLSGKADFTGALAKTPPQVQILVQQNAVRGRVANLPATVVVAHPAPNENIALLKIEVKGTFPVAEISDAPVALDDDVLVLGYYSLGMIDGDRTYAQRSKITNVVRASTTPTDIYKVDSDLGTQSHGGMVVDRSGHVVGLVNPDPSLKDQPRRAAVPGGVLKNLLGAAAVTNELGKVDQAYRAGLDAYFAGRYTEAKQKFDEVLSASQHHQLAADYRRQAVERLAVEGDAQRTTSFGLPFGIGAFSAAIVISVVAAALFLLGRKRRSTRRVPEASVSPWAPVSAAPVSAPPITASYLQGLDAPEQRLGDDS